MSVSISSFFHRGLVALSFILGSSWTGVAASFTEEEIAFFSSEVRPILESHCVKCHGGTDRDGEVKIRSGLQLISRRGILIGGEHGPAFDDETPSDSFLLKMISYADDDHQMPPRGKLPENDLATLTKWVEMGLPWTPEDAERLVEVKEEHANRTEVNAFTQSFWSYKPLERPEVPEVNDPAWQENPIDAFIAHKLREVGLQPNPEASAGTLVRRAFYDLTGLPPTPETAAIFGETPLTRDTWGALVDDLLASRHYGEKWARHWLDTVRYAESNGFERDSDKDFIWRYRDYVIDAFNRDLPYDRFILEQLAGDELDEVTPDSLIATGYHRLMQWDDEPVDALQHRYDVLDDNVRTTSEAFLGMTLGCARCHDHKGDPVPQEDYYRFMAFFNGVTQMDKERVIQTLSAAMPSRERAERKAHRQEELADATEAVMALEKKALAALLIVDPALREEPWLSTATSPQLLPDSRKSAQEWSYTEKAPEDNWFTVGYRPQDWKTGKAPFGRHRRANTQWDSSNIWLQSTFGLTQLPGGLRLTIRHDEDVLVYLNGQLIFEAQGNVDAYRTVDLGEEAVAALQTGRNVVAVHVRQIVGGQFIDLGLEGDYGAERLVELIDKHHEAIFNADEWQSYQEAARRLKDLRSADASEGMRAMLVQERGSQPEPMHVHVRGNANVHGDPVQPSFPVILGGGTPIIPEPGPNAKTSGRRRALAEWIASEENPRTARVMVNRIWQHHFGRGLCPTPNDFGFLGEKPVHTELLDWLACEFMERGWSIKEMHRLIMNSKTYRMSSRGQDEALQRDPQNEFYWRFDMRRLTAEEIRDSMLMVSGKINLAYGGASFYPTLPPEVLATSSTGAGKWGESPREEQNRRSVYMKVKRSLMSPELKDFDFADTDASCAARFVTTVPTQALFMLNSKAVNDHAAAFAEGLREEVGNDPEAQVRRGLELVCGRPPEPAEVARCLEMMNGFIEDHGLDAQESLQRFCLLALNLNEFIYLD